MFSIDLLLNFLLLLRFKSKFWRLGKSFMIGAISCNYESARFVLHKFIWRVEMRDCLNSALKIKVYFDSKEELFDKSSLKDYTLLNSSKQFLNCTINESSNY